MTLTELAEIQRLAMRAAQRMAQPKAAPLATGLDAYYQKTAELGASMVIGGIVFTATMAIMWRPWMR